jgi:hypothetical protein
VDDTVKCDPSRSGRGSLYAGCSAGEVARLSVRAR